MNIYWYISKAKLDLLTEPARLVKELQGVIKRLHGDREIKPFGSLEDADSPTIISFEGYAARLISYDVFWIALESGDTGLLLVGSAAHAIGAQPKADYVISPSADPLACIQAVVNPKTRDEELPDGGNFPLSASMRYAWETLMSNSSEGTLPRVRGLAIFARTLHSEKTFMDRSGKTLIRKIVLASPIYVEQYG
jgi:hypothetical protein